MYKIIETFKFGASHNVLDSNGTETGTHGHDWNVKVVAIREDLNEFNVVIEYKKFRELVQEVIDNFDCKFLNELEEFKNLNPTEESIVRLLYKRLKEKCTTKGLKISLVEIWVLEKRRIQYYE